MKQITVSLVALALAVSSVSASFDISKGGQLGRAHHARAHHDVNGRRATTGKAAYCAAKNATAPALAVAVEAVASVTTSTTPTVKAEPTTTAEKTTTTPKPKPTTTTEDKPDPPKTTAKAVVSSSGGGQSFSGGDMTYYTPGLNACGTVDGPDSFIAAIPHGLWDSWPGFNGNSNQHPLCHKSITVTYKGKSVGVKITDRCGGCENRNSLDLSPDAFVKLATFDEGRVYDISWSL